MEWALALYSSVLVLGALFDSEADGWVAGLPLFLYIPKIQAYFKFDGTLVFNDCMEYGWVNIPALGWLWLGLAMVKRFLFLVTRTTVPS
jgi:hypothetical protein